MQLSPDLAGDIPALRKAVSMWSSSARSKRMRILVIFRLLHGCVIGKERVPELLLRADEEGMLVGDLEV
ncbi:hypothetical protein [Muricoccus aerilatus]|uniref:hypothetical protein n=1 Tax=Muricoccus aerilatus TaxID=452982 RepID=UPI0012EB63BC|nr:hypothetical protein [Roseomonas aerilata]